MAGVSAQVVIKSVAREEGRREAQADPIIDSKTLAKSAQAKLEKRRFVSKNASRISNISSASPKACRKQLSTF